MTVVTIPMRKTAKTTRVARGSSDVTLVSAYQHHGGVTGVTIVVILLMRTTAPLQQAGLHQHQHLPLRQNVHPIEF